MSQATEEDDEGGKLAERLKSEQYRLESLSSLVPLYNGALGQADQALRAGNLLRARQHLLSLQPGGDKPFTDKRIDRRGFDWHYLWRQANPERHTLLGHRGLVHAVAASPDSALLATAGDDGTVRLWNLKRQGEVAAIFTGQGAVLAVAFAPDGKTLASAGVDRTVRIWEVKTGVDQPANADQATKILAGHDGPVGALAFGSDANTLVSGAADKTAIVWDVAAGKAKTTLKDHGDAVEAVAFAPDGKTFATGGKDGGILVWDAEGKQTKSLKVPGVVAGLAFSEAGPAGVILAGASNESLAGGDVGVVRTWDVKSGKEAAAPILCSGGVFGIAFQRKSPTLLVAGKDHAVRAYDATNGKEQRSWRGHFGWVRSVAVTADGAALVSSSYDNTVKVWDDASNETLSHGAGVQALAVARDDELLASGGNDGVVKLWRIKTGQPLGDIKGHPGPITGLAFTADDKERKLAVGSWSTDGAGSVKVWSLTVTADKVDAKEGPEFKGHTKGVQCLALGKNQMLASGSADGTVILWDPATGARQHRLEAGQPVHSLGFSPSGGRLATGDRLGKVRLWETAGGTLLARGKFQEVGAHLGAVQSILFVNEDFEFISGGADHMVKHWSWRLNEEAAGGLISRAHHQPVHCLTPLLGTSFASGASDRTIKLWDLRDAGGGEERLTLVGHPAAIRALTATNNGQTLISASADGSIRLWRASPPMPAR
jgi:WD40 repeat protein